MSRRRNRLVARFGLGAALVATWVLLWGRLSPANLLSGVLVAAALLAVFPLRDDVEHVDHRLRPLAAVHLGLYFTGELIASSVLVARDVLRGPRAVRTAIVACPLRVEADGLATFLANMLALSPGTMPIEVTHHPTVIYLHVLRLDDPESVRRRVARFEELAVAALGSPAMLAKVRDGVEGATP